MSFQLVPGSLQQQLLLTGGEKVDPLPGLSEAAAVAKKEEEVRTDTIWILVIVALLVILKFAFALRES